MPEHYETLWETLKRVEMQYWLLYCVIHNFVIVGPGEVEPEIQKFDSEDANDSTMEKSPKVAEEKPERSKDSTIHTAHQFLTDTSQVWYLMHLLNSTETVCFHWPELMTLCERQSLELHWFRQLISVLFFNSKWKVTRYQLLYMQLNDAFKMEILPHP